MARSRRAYGVIREAVISNGTVKSIGPRFLCLLLAVALLVLTGAQAAQAEPQSLTGAKDEAAALEAQLQELKAQAKVLQEKYDSANARLAETEARAAESADALTQAEQDQLSAEDALRDRLVEIYKQGRSGPLEVLLSSESLSELLDRVTLLKRIGKQDADLVQQVTDYRTSVTDEAARLTAQLEKQQAIATEVEAARQAMADKLAQTQQTLKGKEAEVAQLEKEWKAKQEEQARLAQERQAKLQAALAEAQAAAQEAGHADATTTSGGDSGSSTSTTKPSTSTTKPSTTSTTKKTTTTTSGGGQTHDASIPNILKPEQIALVAQKAGFSGDDLVIAVAVALAESHGDANAIGRLKTYGLWQILASAHPDMISPSNPDASRWYDPYVNARFAWKISRYGATWRPWAVYTNNAYLKYMAKAQAGVDLLLNDPGAVVPPTAK